MLQLSGIQGDSHCCPFCECDMEDDFDFDRWKNIQIGDVWRRGCNQICNISPLHSGFCILHAKLRIIGDKLVQKILWLASNNHKLKPTVQKIQDLIMPNFKVKIEESRGNDHTTNKNICCSSLLGNRCDSFIEYEAFTTICETAGISNTTHKIVDGKDATKQQCKALLTNGCRCIRNRISESTLCQQHHDMRLAQRPPAMASNSKANPQSITATTNHLATLQQLSRDWNILYPILRQSTPYYEDTYAFNIDNELQSLCASQLEVVTNAVADPNPTYASNAHYRIIDPAHKHCNRVYEHIGYDSKEAKLAVLEQALDKFGSNWKTLFGDNSVACYMHILCCHSVQLVKMHGNLGSFSNSGLETFHKVMKWLLNKTNRWGGTQESHVSLDLMRNYYKLLVLNIEHHGCAQMVKDRLGGRRTMDCQCATGGACVWEADSPTTQYRPAIRQRCEGSKQ